MANLWAQFKKLIADSPLLIGTVTALNTDNSTTVTMLGGGVVKVLGQPVDIIGAKVFLRGHEIIGQAPDLSSYMVEV
jgi:hypothetical protein